MPLGIGERCSPVALKLQCAEIPRVERRHVTAEQQQQLGRRHTSNANHGLAGLKAADKTDEHVPVISLDKHVGDRCVRSLAERGLAADEMLVDDIECKNIVQRPKV